MDLWYSNWEQQCVEALESEPDYESQLHNEKELYSQQMWTKFQTTASAIAQLYKGDPRVPTAGDTFLLLLLRSLPFPVSLSDPLATVIPQGRSPVTRIPPVSRNIHFVAPLRERDLARGGGGREGGGGRRPRISRGTPLPPSTPAAADSRERRSGSV